MTARSAAAGHDAAREPLFGLDVPARLTGAYASGDPSAEKLVILPQAYDYPVNQQAIRDICSQLVEHAGVRRILVEGASGRITPTTPLASGISTGVLRLLSEGRPDIEAWGIDDMALHRLHAAAQNTLLQSRADVDEAARALARVLKAARKRHFPRRVRDLRASLILTSVEGRSPGTGVEQLVQLARHLDVDLSAFPLVAALSELTAFESTLDVGRVEQQRTDFIERAIGGALSWFKFGTSDFEVDIEAGTPYLIFWMIEMGFTPDEITSRAMHQDLGPAIGSCIEWYLNWPLRAATESARRGWAGALGFFDDLTRLALFAAIPFFDLWELRRYLTYQRGAQSIPIERFDAERIQLTERLAESTNDPDAAHLVDIERRLDLYLRALRLELDPTRAESVSLRASEPRLLCEELCALASKPTRTLSRTSRSLEAMLPAALEFADHGRRRGVHMAERTLELLGEHDEDRAVLVVGGFHTRAITHALEDSPQISWSVLQGAMFE